MFTPEGQHCGRFWIPEQQQQPFHQQVVPPQEPQAHSHHQQQQPSCGAQEAAGQRTYCQDQPQDQPQQQRLPRQQRRQQSPAGTSKGPHTDSYVRMLETQIALQQEHLGALPRGGPEAVMMITQTNSLLKELKQLRADELHQGQQRRQQQQHLMRGRSRGVMGGGLSSMMGHDPIEAVMEPMISSNPDLRSAKGSRIGGYGVAPPNVAAELLDYVHFGVRETLQETLPAAMAEALLQAGVTACSNLANSVAGGDTQQAHQPASAAAPAAAPARAAASSLHSGTGLQQPSKAAAAPEVREVPFMKDQKSLADMMDWYMKVRDIPFTLSDGTQVTKTRAEMRDLKRCWSSKAMNRRAAEYDVIYDRLKAHAVDLTVASGQPKTVEDAVEHVVAIERVGNVAAGGPTISQYSKRCSKWRAGINEVRAAAQAAAQLDEDASGE